MIRSLILAAAIAVSGSAAIAADDVATPSQISGAKVITVDEAKALSSDKSVTFIDTRSVLNFGKGHVPGAITASYKEESEKVEAFDGSKDKFDFSKLPADKAAKVVFYSDGPTGWKSYKAAVLSVKQGYKNVMYFRTGYASWVEKGLPVER